MRIAVTGGTGFIGSHILESLHQHGHELHCLIRPSSDTRWLEGKPIRLFTGSLEKSESLRPFLEGCSVIVHNAGITRARNEAEFMAVNRDGTVALVDAALSLSRGPRQIIAMSSQAVMGPCTPGTCSHEEDPFKPLTPYGRSKAAMEESLMRYDTDGSMRCTLLRAPGVYGPRDTDFLKYFKLIKRGFRFIIGNDNMMSLVYVKTLAETISACVLNPQAYGQAFFVTDDQPCDWDTFAGMIESALNKKTLRIQIPGALITLFALSSELLKPFMSKPPLLDKNKLLEIRQSCWVLSNSKARRLLGVKPVLETAEAIVATARWYEAQGWL